MQDEVGVSTSVDYYIGESNTCGHYGDGILT